MQEILLKTRYFESGLSKTSTLFSLANQVLMYKVIKNKRGLELVTRRSSVYEKVQKNSFIGYLYFPRPGPGTGPQFVFTGPAPRFVFTSPGPQFVFIGPGSKSVFSGPGP